MPQVSVIVPVYNVEKFICRCVDSILAQTFTDFELILVDDGSADESGKICDQYARIDYRIHVIHQKNQGVSVARNTGIDWVIGHGSSQWITFVDSDDCIHQEYLFVLYSAAKKYNVSVSMCGYKEIYTEEIFVPLDNCVMNCLETEEAFIQNQISIVVWGKLFDSTAFKTIRFPSGKIHEDVYTTYKILFQFSQIAVIDEALYYYRHNENGITKSEWTPRRIDEILAIEEEIEYFHLRQLVRAEKKMIRAYYWALSEQIKQACSNKKYVFYLRRKLRKAIKKYKNIEPISISNNAWIFEAAYPLLMSSYWIGKSLLKR